MQGLFLITDPVCDIHRWDLKAKPGVRSQFAQFGCLRVAFLFFVNVVVLKASRGMYLGNSCPNVKQRVSISKSEAMVLSQKRVYCLHWLGSKLSQVVQVPWGLVHK